MALSSYDDLLKQVENLKMENRHLRRELQDNSSHLTKLENEASNMKDVLNHMGMEDEEEEESESGSHAEGTKDSCGAETNAGGVGGAAEESFAAQQGEAVSASAVEDVSSEDGRRKECREGWMEE